jgi:hypothetical protein
MLQEPVCLNCVNRDSPLAPRRTRYATAPKSPTIRPIKGLCTANERARFETKDPCIFAIASEAFIFLKLRPASIRSEHLPSC